MKGIGQNKYTEQAIRVVPTNLDTGTNLGKKGIYSGKSDRLVLPKRLAFYRKPAKIVKKFGQKGIKTP